MISQANDKPEALAARSGTLERIKTVGRCLRYLGIRTAVVAVTVLVGVYVAIWVTNLGGYADEQRKQEIDHAIALGMIGVGSLPPEERQAVIEEATQRAYAAADLDRPFFVRSFGYWRDAFTLTLGETRSMSNAAGSNDVLTILLGKLPMTVLLFGVSSVLSFLGGLYIALILSRRYGTPLDRASTLVVPALAAPPWFHGLFLIVIFASFARLLPFGGLVDAPPPPTTFGYILSILKHMILPVTASILGTMPHAVYANRALFLIHSTEDYVELAKAKGVRPSRLRMRYILRPVLPAVITNFALVSIVSWQAIILTENVFGWPGLGSLLIDAMRADGTSGFAQETAIVIGAVTLFAYLLGVTILFLDVLYVLVDPRISLGSAKRR
jgi:peptide/nickel transport system permease protein